MFEAIVKELRLVGRLLLDRRVPLWVKGIPLAAVIYVLSPLDLIPDVIIGLGQLDDLGILLGGLRLFKSMIPNTIIQEHRQLIEGNMVEGEVIDVTDYTVRERD